MVFRNRRKDSDSHWANWRTMAGYTYLIICLFDFLIMPLAVHVNARELIHSHQDSVNELKIIDKFGGMAWVPVTMTGGGLFHLSFGAILTGVALAKGQERKEIAKHLGNGVPPAPTEDK
jgi:hypothetical protein